MKLSINWFFVAKAALGFVFFYVIVKSVENSIKPKPQLTPQPVAQSHVHQEQQTLLSESEVDAMVQQRVDKILLELENRAK